MKKSAIKATFVTDKNGTPEFFEADGERHFRMKLSIDGVPDDAYAVTYELDDTYYDAIRENRDRKSAFTEELTSYGDYDLNVKLRTRDGTITLQTTLSKALALGNAEHPTKEVEKAIMEIKGS